MTEPSATTTPDEAALLRFLRVIASPDQIEVAGYSSLHRYSHWRPSEVERRARIPTPIGSRRSDTTSTPVTRDYTLRLPRDDRRRRWHCSHKARTSERAIGESPSLSITRLTATPEANSDPDAQRMVIEHLISAGADPNSRPACHCATSRTPRVTRCCVRRRRLTLRLTNYRGRADHTDTARHRL